MCACANPIYIDRVKDFRLRQVAIPCRHCVSCRIDAIKRWEMRLKYEYITLPSAFVTLTYDDYHLYYNHADVLDADYTRLGVPLGVTRSDFASAAGFMPSLNTTHLTNYIYCLRKHSPNKFRWFCAGEYGSGSRPHYHILFFGLDFAEHAKLFKKCWPHGAVKVLPMQHGSIRYVLKYLSKSQNKDITDSMYFDYDVIPPFFKVSHGLGSGFFALHAQEIADTGFVKIGCRYVPVNYYYASKYLHYSDDLIYNKFRIQDFLSAQIADSARSAGYSDVNKYIDDMARARHDNIVARSRSRRESAPALPSAPYALEDVSRLAYRALCSDDAFALDTVFDLCDNDTVIPF